MPEAAPVTTAILSSSCSLLSLLTSGLRAASRARNSDDLAPRLRVVVQRARLGDLFGVAVALRVALAAAMQRLLAASAAFGHRGERAASARVHAASSSRGRAHCTRPSCCACAPSIDLGAEDQALGHARAAQPRQPLRAAGAGQQAQRRLRAGPAGPRAPRRAGRRPAPVRARRRAPRRRSRPASTSGAASRRAYSRCMPRTTSVIASGPLRRREAGCDQRQVGAGAERRADRCAGAAPRRRRRRSRCSSTASQRGDQRVVERVDRRARQRRDQHAADAFGWTPVVAHRRHPSVRCSSCSLRRSSLPVGVRGKASTACSQRGRW